MAEAGWHLDTNVPSHDAAAQYGAVKMYGAMFPPPGWAHERFGAPAYMFITAHRQ